MLTAVSFRPLLAALLLAAAQTIQAGTPLRVQLPAGDAPASGRLLVSLQPAAVAEAEAEGKPVRRVSVSPFGAADGALIGMDVPALLPGKPLTVDVETRAWPSGLAELPAGEYYLQATLDTARDDNYGGRDDNISSAPVKVTLGQGGDLPLLILDQRQTAPADPWDLPTQIPEPMRKQMLATRPQIRALDLVSERLSAFWGRPIHMRGWVVLPPGYEADAQTRYPVVFETHGFGGTLRSQLYSGMRAAMAMQSGSTPPMLWVFLDQSSATGTHEFADSVNNGPWGSALTEELIPDIDREYRTDGRASGRFVTGHSSGGWAALWLQVRYPKVFGGSWPTAPDSGDFRDFTGADLYGPNANVYRRADGSPIPLVRMQGKVVATFEKFARLEEVTGPYGGQMASFEWVFSPRGADGRPVPMFDRRTGAVDPAVAAYWRDHFDVAQRIVRDWPQLKPDLDGKLHLIVGTADTFYLEGGARRLEAAMRSVGAKTGFRFLPDRSHFDLYAVGDDRSALSRTIAWEMYKVARPEAVVPADLPEPELEPGH